MDEIKLSLKTKFMKGMVARLLDRAILKQTGVKVSINLDELDITNDGDHVFIRTNLVAKVDEKDILKVMSKL